MQDELLDDHQQTSLRFYYDLKTLRNVTLIIIGGALLLFLIRIFFIVIANSLVDNIQRGENIDRFLWYANMVDILEIIVSFLILAGIVPFLMWLYRVYYNLQNVQLKGLHTTAGWAVGWFFIPIVNLFYYDIVILNDLMRGTKHLYTGGTPSQSIEHTPVAPLGLFWALSWIFASLLDTMAENAILAGNANSFTNGLLLEIFSDTLYTASGAIIFYIVFWVSKKQVEITRNETNTF